MTSLSFKDFQNAQTSLANAAPAAPFSSAGDVLAARFSAGVSTGSTGRNLNSLDASRRFYAEMDARGVPAAQWAEEARFSEAERRGSKGAGNYQPSGAPTDIYNTEIADLVWQRYVRENPNAAVQSLGPRPSVVADEIGRTAEAVAQELSSRAGTLGSIAGLVGDLGAGILTPETLATALFTPVRVAAVGWSAVSKVAGREAAFGAGFEIPAQAAIQSYKEDIGIPHGGFWESATNVAVVGGLSGVLGGTIRGVVEWRNSIRAGRTIPGSAARRLFDDLSPGAKRELEDVSSDAAAVEAIVSRQFETNARFRERLTLAEREGIERAIQFRQNLRPFAPRTPAEVDTLARVMDNVGAVVASGLPLRPEDVPAVAEALIARARAKGVDPQTVEGAIKTGDVRTGAFGLPTQETLDDLRRLFPEVAEDVDAAAARTTPDPTVTAKPGPTVTAKPGPGTEAQPEFRFARGQEKELDALLEKTGRSRQDVRAAIDAGAAPVGARGQITSKTIDALDTAFDILPETLRPREGAVPDAPRNVAEMQDRSTALAGDEATTARLGADEVKVMKAQTEEARGEAAEEILRARLGEASGGPKPEAEPPSSATPREVSLPVVGDSGPSSSVLYVDGGRVHAIMDIGGVRLPFYISTGSGGKASVPAGKWYPYFGYDREAGWFNKGTEAQINDFYGVPALREAAGFLNAKYGDLRPQVYEGVLPIAQTANARASGGGLSQMRAVDPSPLLSHLKPVSRASGKSGAYIRSVLDTLPKQEPRPEAPAAKAPGAPDPAQASAREALDEVNLLRAQEDAIEVCRNG